MVLLAATSCGRPVGGTEPGAPVTGIVGTWTVTATGGPDAEIVLDEFGFELRADGPLILFGGWRHDPSGPFVAHVSSATGSPEKGPLDLSTPPWLLAASAVQVDGADRVLLDGSGVPTARLVDRRDVPAADPPRPVALPGGLAPVDRARLLGTWVPPGDPVAPQPPHVRFAGNGDWNGSDGCNGGNGRWTVGPDGVLLATGGPMTLIGCDGMVGVPGWLAATTRAGMDGATLVLVDVTGAELGRLQRA